MATTPGIVYKLLKSLNLRGVKRMGFTFDPYHQNVQSIRETLFYANTPRILDTNLNCSMKINVKSDRSDPFIEVLFNDDTKTVYKTKNLETVDIVRHLHGICAEKDPNKDEGDSIELGKKPSKRKK